MNKFCSIVITHWSMNKERSDKMRISLNSLIDTLDYPSEIIVVDNGNNLKDSKFLLTLNIQKKINVYLRNSENLSFGYARNQGMYICNGDYICIADNDIHYRKGWLSSCIKVLEAYPDEKIYATPIHTREHVSPRYWTKPLVVDGEIYKTNYREGSNCFVISRKNMAEIGCFSYHRIAGTVWTNYACRKGFTCAITPTAMAKDIGVHRGYNIKMTVPLKEVLSDGTEIYFNQDSFRRMNKRTGKQFRSPRVFI